MKPIKGLNRDSRPHEQPDGTYPFGKNGIQHDQPGSVFNEPGFELMDAVAPYRIIGIIETDDKPVLISTDNTNTAFGYFNPALGTYEAIIDDATWGLTGTIGFNTDRFVTGVSQRNYKGELVIACTDKSVFPIYLNCDNPGLESINDLRLFPFFTPPVISATQMSGGRLSAGAYYIAVGYERNDGTSTPYSEVSEVVVVTPDANGGRTGKALEITITQADATYDMLRVAIIAKVDGKTTAVELQDFIPISSGTVQFIYTGDNLTTDISVEEVLTPAAQYETVGTIGQLNDALYLAVLESEADFNELQPYALAVQPEWVSELIDATAPPLDHVNGVKRGMMHEEVYAAYIRYTKTRGGKTKWFHIPGVSPTSLDTGASTEATTGGSTTSVPKFKVEDTIGFFDPIAKRGKPGIWQNATETYPDTADFDASGIGGRNLRGEKVLHHKMPSLRWCKQNLYASETEYGKTKLDLLGIRLTNVRIPTALVGLVSGYELGFAKRTTSNMTVYGQSALLHGAVNNFDLSHTTANSEIYTTGGNWRSEIFHQGKGDYNDNWELVQVRRDTMRFHAFDILFTRPSIEPTFISSQLKLKRENLITEGYVEDGSHEDEYNMPTTHLVDYTRGLTPVVAATGEKLRTITDSFYLTGQINSNRFQNMRHEACFAGVLGGTNWPLNVGTAAFRIRGQGYTEPSIGSPGFEETYLVNLIGVKTDIYANFYSQLLVSAGRAKSLTDTSVFWGGDTFVVDYTFHTYGRHDSIDTHGEGIKGKKVIRRLVCESAANLHLRYELDANQYSKWYPRTSVTAGPPTNHYITLFDRSIEPNQFGYSRDLNSLNELTSSVIFSPYREEITSHPYRVHRGGKQSRQARPRSWRTFLPLDFYECQKNMGAITHLEGMDDHLLIHHENALFRTQDKAKLDAGLLSVTLGSGDIFQFEPQEAISAKLGYAGTQHELACVRTPIGYVFLDAKLGELYIYKGEPKNLNQGLNAFLREYLKITENNPFTGNGVTIGWDQKYKRILLTVKNSRPTITDYKIYEDTDDFWSDLTVGDIILKDGRYIEYLGPNTSEFDCPDDSGLVVYTWQREAPYCLVNSDGETTGMIGYALRQRLADGVLDGTYEINEPNGGTGTYFPPEVDDSSPAECSASPTIEWEGMAPYCEQDSTCAVGVLSNGQCFETLTEAATAPEETLALIVAASSKLWNRGGALVYQEGFNLDGSGTVLANITTPVLWLNGTAQWNQNSDAGVTSSRMNAAGVWTSPVAVLNEWIGFSHKMTGVAGQVIHVGISSVNAFKIRLNGEVVVSCPTGQISGSEAYNYLHIYPISLRNGDNYIEMFGMNFEDTPGLVAEIYDNTLPELQGAAVEGDLNILFSSKDKVGYYNELGSIYGYSCPAGYSLDISGSPAAYSCVKINVTPATGTNSTTKYFTMRRLLINDEPTGLEQENDYGENYVEPITDATECPLGSPDQTPPEQNITGTIALTDLGEVGVGLQIELSAAPTLALRLRIGARWAGSPADYYVGSELFTPGANDSLNPDYDEDEPFYVIIPAGEDSITISPAIWQDGRKGQENSQWLHDETLEHLYIELQTPSQRFSLALTGVGITVTNV
jgi:hypothetical protein